MMMSRKSKFGSDCNKSSKIANVNLHFSNFHQYDLSFFKAQGVSPGFPPARE